MTRQLPGCRFTAVQENGIFQVSKKFDNSEKEDVNQEILDRVTRIIFMAFMPDDAQMSDKEFDELIDESSGMASIIMAVAGMDVIGENSHGDYVARFSPYDSLEHFGKENGLQ